MQILNLLSLGLVISIFFIFRGYGWPFGKEGIEAFGAFLIYLFITIFHIIYFRKKHSTNILQEKSVRIGLLIGILWTTEICINNIIMPTLPARDILDNIFWAVIALIILLTVTIYVYRYEKIATGITNGLWTGLASGSVASMTALIFIVFGMKNLVSDPLNISEWSAISITTNTPNINVYFAYQTLAGAILHLIVLGIIMGIILGFVGGIIGRNIKRLIKFRECSQ